MLPLSPASPCPHHRRRHLTHIFTGVSTPASCPASPTVWISKTAVISLHATGLPSAFITPSVNEWWVPGAVLLKSNPSLTICHWQSSRVPVTVVSTGYGPTEYPSCDGDLVTFNVLPEVDSIFSNTRKTLFLARLIGAGLSSWKELLLGSESIICSRQEFVESNHNMRTKLPLQTWIVWGCIDNFIWFLICFASSLLH